MKTKIIGREREQHQLERYVQSDHSEFIAIYGRRRVGKTFLVKELFDGAFMFRMTGKEQTNLHGQLQNFFEAFCKYAQPIENEIPKTWAQAFHLLTDYLEQQEHDKTKILFFDELPWLDTYGSEFVSALEHFWNNWANYRNDIKLIVCGSATTWMLDNLINARGGLHNRVTHTILLSPFTLHEVELYFKSRGFNYGRSEIIECYMAMGGVAYYLSLFETDKSVAQNINDLCFRRGGELHDEFSRVFRSLYKRAENHIAVLMALQKKGMGMTRQEIITAAKQTNNGNLTVLLNELEACDFIRSYTPFGKTKKDKTFQLIDPFTLFHFNFIHGESNILSDYWQKMQNTRKYSNWCGYAFEITCLNHIEQIVRALGIDGTISIPCAWIYRPAKQISSDEDADEDLRHGAQIDLLIDRADKTISICEMKYCTEEYEITKSYDDLLTRRMRIFRKVTKTKKSLMPTFITPFGLHNNMYARKISRIVTADQLFGV